MSDPRRDSVRSQVRALSQGLSDGLQAGADLHRQVAELRAVLLRLLWCHAEGTAPPLHEEPFRSLLGLPASVTAEEAEEHLRRMHAPVLGTLTCPQCGARVPDREGVVDESCGWCGTPLHSAG